MRDRRPQTDASLSCSQDVTAETIATVDHATVRLVAAAAVASRLSWSGLAQTLSDLSAVLQALPSSDADGIARALLGRDLT